MKLFWMMLFVLAFSCSPTTESETQKPLRDPDAHMVSGKSDVLTTYYTEIKGSLDVDGPAIMGSIGYPDWFHGYTMELEEGQNLRFEVFATELGYLRVYGPATRVDSDGNPRFGRPLLRGELEDDGEFTMDITESGTYLILYGPKYVWSADFSFQIYCDNCTPDSCNGDWECGAGEFCGDNGVRCVRAPCDANYDVCQPQVGTGEFCMRDEMCSPGSLCINDACETSTACNDNSDCVDQFCGYDANGGRLCKPFAAEGTLCGGFVRPQDYHVCPPDLQCNAPTWVADVGGTCGLFVTVAELNADPARYDGRHVSIIGSTQFGPTACTRIYCSTDNPCCNNCSTGITLVDAPGDVSNIALKNAGTGEAWSCSGDDCNPHETCTADESEYFVSGTFEAGQWGNTLNVTRSFRGIQFN